MDPAEYHRDRMGQQYTRWISSFQPHSRFSLASRSRRLKSALICRISESRGCNLVKDVFVAAPPDAKDRVEGRGDERRGTLTGAETETGL